MVALWIEFTGLIAPGKVEYFYEFMTIYDVFAVGVKLALAIATFYDCYKPAPRSRDDLEGFNIVGWTIRDFDIRGFWSTR